MIDIAFTDFFLLLERGGFKRHFFLLSSFFFSEAEGTAILLVVYDATHMCYCCWGWGWGFLLYISGTMLWEMRGGRCVGCFNSSLGGVG